jgi:hypothetical protein
MAAGKCCGMDGATAPGTKAQAFSPVLAADVKAEHPVLAATHTPTPPLQYAQLDAAAHSAVERRAVSHRSAHGAEKCAQ